MVFPSELFSKLFGLFSNNVDDSSDVNDDNLICSEDFINTTDIEIINTTVLKNVTNLTNLTNSTNHLETNHLETNHLETNHLDISQTNETLSGNYESMGVYYLLILITILGVIIVKNFFQKPNAKQIIRNYFSSEIRHYIFRTRMNSLYYLTFNIITLALQIGIIYLVCPDLFVLMRLVEPYEDYEGFSYYLNYALKSTSEIVKIIITYTVLI